jgi:hypothetical protein
MVRGKDGNYKKVNTYVNGEQKYDDGTVYTENNTTGGKRHRKTKKTTKKSKKTKKTKTTKRR